MTPRAWARAALLLALGCRREDLPARAASDDDVGRAAPAPRYAPALRDVLRLESRRALDESTVTLLVPDDPALVATAVVTSGPNWAALSVARGDHTISLHASRAVAPPVAPAPPARRTGARAPRPEEPVVESRIRGLPAALRGGDGQRVATWEERGVTYVLGVACTRAEDPRCGSERFLRDLAASLVRLEGGR